MNGLSRNERLLLVAFLALLLLPLLYLLRAWDDNTLTSWRWVFGKAGVVPLFGLAAAGLAVALLLAKTAKDRHAPGLVLFLLSWAAVLPLWSGPEMILDASRYFLQAKHLELYGVRSFLREWGRGVSAWTDLPLVPFLYGLVFRYLGEARLFAQALTTLLFSLTVLLTAQIGGKLWDRETGLYAGLLLLGIPYLLTQVPLLLVDVPAMFFFTLAVYAFLNALEKGGGLRALGAALAVALGLFSKYSVPLMLLVLALIALVRGRQNAKETIIRSAAIGATAALFAFALIWPRAGVFRAQLGLLRAYQLPGLSRWKESPASTFFFQVHPFITLLALFGARVAVRRKDLRFLVPAWFGVFAVHVERIRYILPLFPLLTLAAAYGLRALKEREVRRFIAFSAVALSLVIALGAYLPFFKSTSMANLMRAGAYLDSLPGDSAVVRVLPQHESSGDTAAAVPILDLYTKKRLFYDREGLIAPGENEIADSSLRFTWECPLPDFYDGARLPGGPLVVLSSFSPADGMPQRPKRQFAQSSGTFRFKTLVTVYQDAGLAERGQNAAPRCSLWDSAGPLSRESPRFSASKNVARPLLCTREKTGRLQ